jgi:hypothetical protein
MFTFHIPPTLNNKKVFDELELSTGIFDDYGNYASYLSSDPSKGTAPSPK